MSDQYDFRGDFPLSARHLVKLRGKPFMLRWRQAFFLLLSVVSANAFSQNLALDLYQNPDGAITVNEHGDFVDPYFANRALTLADESGIEVRLIAERWILWLIAH